MIIIYIAVRAGVIDRIRGQFKGPLYTFTYRRILCVYYLLNVLLLSCSGRPIYIILL